ncbi:MAG: Flp pilus assembly complex ATPase component TadA [Clostridiales Family XIII bacterium]|jgi:pilus assembly protein CpaF|nr:Flp pilus assembly complex ATPase component TadA [Clostridiales Family XIII bacterium]
MENLIAHSEQKEFHRFVKEVNEAILGSFQEVTGRREDKEEFLKNIIRDEIRKKQPALTSLSGDALVDRLYMEAVGFSFLSYFLEDKDVEEITVNGYDDVKITYSDGKKVPAGETFASAKHCRDIIQKLLRHSNMILDEMTPIVRGHLSDKVRITAYSYPVVDERAGASASIRIVNPKNFTRGDFIANGTCTGEMLDLLSALFAGGISMVSVGATGSGKTTLMSYLLSSLPIEQRVVTIENQVREFNLVKHDEDGRVINDVVHLITKEFLNYPERNVSQEKLLEYALTSNPDVICIGECKSEEAFTGQEAARTGHTVITTVHANDCVSAYDRLTTLCRMAYDYDEKFIKSMVEQAFPVVFYTRKDLKTNERKITEIMECVTSETEFEKRYRTLYVYKKTEGGGEFKKVNELSEGLKKRLLANGMSEKELKGIL